MAKSSSIEPINIDLYEKAWGHRPKPRKKKQLPSKKKTGRKAKNKEASLRLTAQHLEYLSFCAIMARKGRQCTNSRNPVKTVSSRMNAIIIRSRRKGR